MDTHIKDIIKVLGNAKFQTIRVLYSATLPDMPVSVLYRQISVVLRGWINVPKYNA